MRQQRSGGGGEEKCKQEEGEPPQWIKRASCDAGRAREKDVNWQMRGDLVGFSGCIKWALRDWQRSSDPPCVINTALGSLITGTDLTVFTIEWTAGIQLCSCVFVSTAVCLYIINCLSSGPVFSWLFLFGASVHWLSLCGFTLCHFTVLSAFWSFIFWFQTFPS